MTPERKPHVHADLIKAWADGHKIQCRSVVSGDWVDLADHVLRWVKTAEYRIKPEPKTWYQVVCRARSSGDVYTFDRLFNTEVEFLASPFSTHYDILKLIPVYTEE